MTNQIPPARLAELRKAAEETACGVLELDAALVLALLNAAEERDAYRKAKQENDERFMLERDEARAQLAAAQLALVDVAAAALAAHKVMTGDAAPESLTAKSAIRAGLANHDHAIRTALKAQP